jgi:ubiquinol-cytochrome c reductase iron-sulfur subunit
MSDMEEVEGPEGPVAPHRVIGTPPPTPRLLGAGDGAEDGGTEHGTEVEPAEERLPTEPDYPSHASNAEKIVAACFVLAFLAGCGFIAAYIGLEVHSVDAVLRSNLALGLSLSVALLAWGSAR